MQSLAIKGLDGQWSIQSSFDLACGRKLKVRTQKSSQGLLYTSAQAVEVTPSDTRGISFEKFVMYQDFFKQVMQHPEVKRVTSASITAAHAKALENIGLVIDAANLHYDGKTA